MKKLAAIFIVGVSTNLFAQCANIFGSTNFGSLKMKMFWMAFPSLALSFGAAAEPSGLVNKLMNTQVSLFSYGLEKLKDDVRGRIKKEGWYSSVQYNWDANRITINITSFNSENFCSNDITCLNLVKTTMQDLTRFWCLTSKNSSESCDTLDLVTGKFQITGYEEKSFYANKNSGAAIKDIKNIVDITGTLYGEKKNYVCTKRYVEKEFLCGATTKD